MKIYLGADHRGFELKGKLLTWLSSVGYQVEDCGAFEKTDNDDYVDFASKVAKQVSESDDSRGIVICGSGIGVDIVANRFKNIRCGLGFDKEQVKSAREDDDINVLALSSDFTDGEKAEELILAFLQTEFKPTENHTRRIGKINSL